MMHLFKLKNFLILAFLGFLFSNQTIGQTFTINNDTSFLEVHGTSSLHDWHVDAQKQSGTLTINSLDDLDIKNLFFKVFAESLKSGKKRMDKNTYKALNTNEFKTIDFTLLSVNSKQKISDTDYKLSVSGDLTISGITNKISLQLKLTIHGDTIAIEGEKSILMTDYGIAPPKALLGTIKTGDEIKIVFKAVFEN